MPADVTIRGAAITLGGVAAAAVAASCGYASMAPASQWFGRTLIAGDDPNEIALTFDDGPNGDTTLRLLDTLAAHQVVATFFLVGNYAKSQPEVVRRIVSEGHAIGNHTMSHPRLLRLTPAATRRQLSDASRVLADIAGVEPRIFRPPFGGRWPYTLAIARELGMTPVMWNAMGRDWALTDPAAIAARLQAGITANRRRGRGSNLLLHDGSHLGPGADREATLAAVARLLHSRNENEKFVSVENWLA